MSAEELGVTGVALVRDVQAWSGLVRLKEPIEVLKQELRTYRDELGNELLDLPEMDLPEDLPDMPALALRAGVRQPHPLPRRPHAWDLRRVPQEGPSLGRAGQGDYSCRWHRAGRLEDRKCQGRTTLVIEPFEHLSPEDSAALREEGERLVRFVAEDEEESEVRFA